MSTQGSLECEHKAHECLNKTSPCKSLKKQATYSIGMNYHQNQEDFNLDESNLASYLNNRANSLIDQEQVAIFNQHTLLSSNLSHNLSCGNNMSNLTDKNTNCFKLHRTSEIENLADQKLVDDSTYDDENAGDLVKSNIELFNHTAHLKRTLELENLTEINNDE